MRVLFAATLAAMTSPALAQQVPADVAIQVLADGRILSFTDVSKYGPDPVLQFPQNQRTHELFSLYDGRLYLCYLIGSNTSGTEPRATCFGRS